MKVLVPYDCPITGGGRHLKEQNSPIKSVAKIEKPKAVDNIEAIIRASDAIMLARGDVGVKMPAVHPMDRHEYVRSVPATVCWQGISSEHGCHGYGVQRDTP